MTEDDDGRTRYTLRDKELDEVIYSGGDQSVALDELRRVQGR